jgi:hypothetical protein
MLILAAINGCGQNGMLPAILPLLARRLKLHNIRTEKITRQALELITLKLSQFNQK